MHFFFILKLLRCVGGNSSEPGALYDAQAPGNLVGSCFSGACPPVDPYVSANQYLKYNLIIPSIYTIAMNHLIKISEIKHIYSNGEVLWKDRNLLNTLHNEGEELVFKVMFTNEEDVPVNYYFGLDNRATVSVNDTINSLVDEPNPLTGYERQAIASGIAAFSIGISSEGDQMVEGPIVSFQHTNSGLGGFTVRNMFLTNVPQGLYTGTAYLMATVPLTNPITVYYGELIQVRLGLALRDISP